MGKGDRNREDRVAAPGEESNRLGKLKRGLGRIWNLLEALSWGQRITIGAGVCLIGLVAYLVLPQIPGAEHVEFNVRADQGTTTFSLVPLERAVSPGCGCPHPEFGKEPWQGMSIPSRAFRLNLDWDGSEEIAGQRWSLTAMAPSTGTINWYGEPNRAVQVRVEKPTRYGWWTDLYNGPASYFQLWTDRPLAVRQPWDNPYAALLPAAGGSTTFTSREPARAQWDDSIEVATTAPRSGQADPLDGVADPETGQRGPMIDLLGRTVTFETTFDSETRMWAALREIHGAKPGDKVVIHVTTPFAVRLIPHPVQTDWEEEVTRNTSRRRISRFLSSSGDAESPAGRARIFLRGSLPPFTLRMRNVKTPADWAWEEFARRSEADETITEMMPKTDLDPLPSEVWDWGYSLPPVTDRPQIGVFGKIEKFQSTSIAGSVVDGSEVRAIPRGQKVKFESEDGLGAGEYDLTPLVSSDQTTSETSIYGDAKVYLDGAVITHPGWMSWGRPAGTILTALLGAVLGVAASWWFGRRRDPYDRET